MSDLTSQTQDQMERDHDKIDRLLRQRDEARALLREARCPNLNCDNEGTAMETAYDEHGDPHPEPAPCGWCHERNVHLHGERD